MFVLAEVYAEGLVSPAGVKLTIFHLPAKCVNHDTSLTVIST